MNMETIERAAGQEKSDVKSPISMKKREACTKAFLDLTTAVDEYLLTRTCPEPKCHADRFGYAYDLEKKDPCVAEIGLSERLGARFDLFHEACFHDSMEFAEDEIKKSKALTKIFKELPLQTLKASIANTAYI